MAIDQIAKESGVSISTVSRVLNNDTGVSDELRRKTLEIMEKYDYKPRSNVKRGTRIAVLVSHDGGLIDRLATSRLRLVTPGVEHAA